METVDGGEWSVASPGRAVFGATGTTPVPRRVQRTPRLGRWPRAEYDRLSEVDGMPPATADHIAVERDIPVPAHDGTILLTDHWFGQGSGPAAVLVRTPYGRRGMDGVATFLAERGHHVVIQSCRGTFGSGGSFDPLHDDVSDGQATLTWLRAQPWAAGPIHTFGFSYVGLTQWAMADGPDRPDAMVIGLSSRAFDQSMVYPGRGFAMETVLAWEYALDMQERVYPAKLWRLLRAKRQVLKGALAIPPGDAVRVACGTDSAVLRDWLSHSAPHDEWWRARRFANLPGTPPVTLLAGWQDLFLRAGFDDYRMLLERGDSVRLIVGDWTHHGDQAGVVAVRELLRGLASAAPAPAQPTVHVDVAGGGPTLAFSQWPPPSDSRTWWLGGAGELSTTRPTSAAELTYRYDPADPTPQVGGRSLNPFVSGRRDQRPREERADVLVFSSEPLAEDLHVIGEPVLDLAFASSNPRADLFVRLCDVDTDGVSLPAADGYVRRDSATADAPRIRLALTPTAYRFAAGHRLRVQVSSGAHPLVLRNPGTADPLHDFSRLVPSIQKVGTGGDDASALELPVVPIGSIARDPNPPEEA